MSWVPVYTTDDRSYRCGAWSASDSPKANCRTFISGQAGVATQSFDVGGDDAQVFGDQRELAEGLAQGVEKG